MYIIIIILLLFQHLFLNRPFQRLYTRRGHQRKTRLRSKGYGADNEISTRSRNVRCRQRNLYKFSQCPGQTTKSLHVLAMSCADNAISTRSRNVRCRQRNLYKFSQCPVQTTQSLHALAVSGADNEICTRSRSVRCRQRNLYTLSQCPANPSLSFDFVTRCDLAHYE